MLPVEFARISDDGRLTLVLLPGVPKQMTYWAESDFTDLDKARDNLRIREGTSKDNVHSVDGEGQCIVKVHDDIRESIHAWLTERASILDAAVWTGLPSRWPKERGEFTPGDAAAYLLELEERAGQARATLDRAREYVRNTPPQIQTTVRQMIRERLGWSDAELPGILFED